MRNLYCIALSPVVVDRAAVFHRYRISCAIASSRNRYWVFRSETQLDSWRLNCKKMGRPTAAIYMMSGYHSSRDNWTKCRKMSVIYQMCIKLLCLLLAQDYLYNNESCLIKYNSTPTTIDTHVFFISMYSHAEWVSACLCVHTYNTHPTWFWARS